MYTKPLVQQSITSVDLTGDLSAIRRLLLAAAISQPFCNTLLGDPDGAARNGFGGERFLISESTLSMMSSVRAETLTDFIYRLDEKLSNSLLGAENFGLSR